MALELALKAWAGGQLTSPREAFSSLLTRLFGAFLDRSGELDFSTFLTIMHMQTKQEDPKKEILLAMLMADKEKKGYIMASELRSRLMQLGEKLTPKEGNGLGPYFPTVGGDQGVGGTPKSKSCHVGYVDIAFDGI